MGAVVERLNLPLPMVKNHLRVDLDDDNALIQSYAEAAKVEADEFMGNQFDTDVATFRGNGTAAAFTLPHKPVWAVTEALVGGKPAVYTLDPETGVVTFQDVPDWGARIKVTYEADLPIPEPVRTWVLNRVAYKYERRTPGVTSQSDPSGSVGWLKDTESGGVEMFADLWRFRKNPGF